MATVTAYSGAGDAFLQTNDADYQTARETATATVDDNETVVYVGQMYNSETGYFCYQAPLDFDISSAVGTILSATMTLTPDSLTEAYVGFTLDIRAYDFGVTVTAADWRAGSALSALPLYGSKATSAMVAGTGFDSTITQLANTAVVDNVRVVLTSSRHRDGVEPSTNPSLRIERVAIRASDYAGTTSDPKLLIEDFAGPSLCTIVAPTEGYSYSTAGVISLTANATDPTPDTVRFHWDYSYQGGAWTACANSPSGYVASGANASIDFDMAALAGYGSVAFRVRAFDGTNYSLAYVQVVTVYTSQQSGMTLFRSDGAIAVANPVSGVVIRRPLSAPAVLTFAVDNFDATEAAIADNDDLVLTVNTHEGSTYQFRGQVTRKTVGDIMEIEAQDIARTFDRLPVTRSLTNRKLGALIKDIIENPTGSDPTGIIATCDEFDDPLNPGNDLVVSVFAGEGRTISQWLALARDWTGYEWYCEYSSGSWRFHWFNPAGNSAWAVAVKDTIGYESESASQAVVLSSPTKLVDRSQYANRVNYYDTTPNPGLPANTFTFDALYSESATGWTAESPATVAASSTKTTTGIYAIRGQRVYSSSQGHIFLYLPLNALHYDWTAEGFGYITADVYVDATTAVGNNAYVAMIAVSGAFDGSYGSGNDPVRGFPLGEPGVIYNSTLSINRLSMWNQFSWDLSSSAYDQNSFDPQDVRTLVFLFYTASGATLTETVNVYWDNIRFRPRSGEPESYWRETYVETAAVTAGTEDPLTVYADTRGLNFGSSASLAKQYLTQLSTPRTTINTVDVSGIRGSVTMESDVTTTLSTRGITAVDYPVAAIEYHLMDQGDLTRLTLGKREQDVLAGIQKLVQRVQQIDAGFRLV